MSRYVGFSGLSGAQYSDEMHMFLDFVRNNNISTYLEIGLFRGDTIHAVGTNMPEGSILVGIGVLFRNEK